MDDVTRKKIGLLIPRLASDQDGEVVATVAAIIRTLGRAGLDLHDLVKGMGGGGERVVYRTVYTERKPEQSEFKAKADFCAARPHRLRPNETEFASDMAAKLEWLDTISPKQAAWLEAIYQRLKRGEENAA